jgi:putative FmdB family regulatory protein
MPTYEYRCSSCGCTFEEFHRMNDSAPRKCTECGETADRMIGTGSGIIFKGSGFYATDYAKGKCGESNGSCPTGGCCGGNES